MENEFLGVEFRPRSRDHHHHEEEEEEEDNIEEKSGLL